MTVAHALSIELQIRESGLLATGRPGEARRRVGTLRTGEALPGMPLAEQLRVNRNTVAKAYRLEAQGIVENLAGKGCFLRETLVAVQERCAAEAAGGDAR